MLFVVAVGDFEAHTSSSRYSVRSLQ